MRILVFLLLIIVSGCNNSNPAASQPPGNSATPSKVKPADSKLFIKSLGIMATIPSDHIKAPSKNVFRMYSPDGLFEYFCTWDSQQTPDMMRRAFKAGTDMGNGMFSRYIGDIVPISPTAEAFNYGVYLFENAQQILSGYEIHDWSSERGVLIITVMGTMENASVLKDKAMSLYQSVEILSKEKLAEVRSKIKSDRETIGRNEDEQLFYSKVADNTLLNVQMYGGNPPLTSEQRFELCNAGPGRYELKSGGGQNVSDEVVSGSWDIVEDDDGVMLLVITSENGKEDKWAIGHHKSGNVTIGSVEFIIHAKGSPDGPASCN